MHAPATLPPMESFLVLLGLFLFAVLVVLPIWTIVKILRQRSDQEILQQQLTALQQEIDSLRSALSYLQGAPAQPVPAPAQPVAASPVAPATPAPTQRTHSKRMVSMLNV